MYFVYGKGMLDIGGLFRSTRLALKWGPRYRRTQVLQNYMYMYNVKGGDFFAQKKIIPVILGGLTLTQWQ